MSQMHLAFVHAHNTFVDGARASGQPEARVFAAAARELIWHYQTVVLREFLRSLIGAELTDLIVRGDRRYYRPRDQPFIPLEFADAAYRYSHSQIRHRYQLNPAGGAVPIFPNLLGFRPVAAEHQIEWSRHFDAAGAPPAARAKKIDGRLVGTLVALPVRSPAPQTWKHFIRSPCVTWCVAKASVCLRARRWRGGWASGR
jgi:hypothetical protein